MTLTGVGKVAKLRRNITLLKKLGESTIGAEAITFADTVL
jgi:hypothetical protein